MYTYSIWLIILIVGWFIILALHFISTLFIILALFYYFLFYSSRSLLILSTIPSLLTASLLLTWSAIILSWSSPVGYFMHFLGMSFHVLLKVLADVFAIGFGENSHNFWQLFQCRVCWVRYPSRNENSIVWLHLEILSDVVNYYSFGEVSTQSWQVFDIVSIER
jgi:hypothetical protein